MLSFVAGVDVVADVFTSDVSSSFVNELLFVQVALSVNYFTSFSLLFVCFHLHMDCVLCGIFLFDFWKSFCLCHIKFLELMSVLCLQCFALVILSDSLMRLYYYCAFVFVPLKFRICFLIAFLIVCVLFIAFE